MGVYTRLSGQRACFHYDMLIPPYLVFCSQMSVLSRLKRKSKKLEPKADYLEKKSSDGRWAKRYFELEQSKLHYYTSKGQGYRQTINVRGVPVHLLDTDQRVIEIKSEDRMYHVRAKNSSIAVDWLKALQNHSQP